MKRILTFLAIASRVLAEKGDFLCCYNEKTDMAMMSIEEMFHLEDCICLSYKHKISQDSDNHVISGSESIELDKSLDEYKKESSSGALDLLHQHCEEQKLNYATKSWNYLKSLKEEEEKQAYAGNQRSVGFSFGQPVKLGVPKPKTIFEKFFPIFQKRNLI